jgi:hypothetical protein
VDNFQVRRKIAVKNSDFTKTGGGVGEWSCLIANITKMKPQRREHTLGEK